MMLHFVPIDSQLWTQFVMDRISRQTDNYGKNNINLSQRGDGGGGGRERVTYPMVIMVRHSSCLKDVSF